jgi:hypothetical protein
MPRHETRNKVIPARLKAAEARSAPSDVIGNAVLVMKFAIGEEPDDRADAPAPNTAAQLGKLGGAARAKALTGKSLGRPRGCNLRLDGC